MTTPDEAAAGGLARMEAADEGIARRHVRAGVDTGPIVVSGLLQQLGDLRSQRERLLAKLAAEQGARTELLTTQQILAHAERQRDEAEARVAAQQPVIDAAEAWDAAWVMGTAGVREGTALHNALVRYESTPRAALGSAEADAPAESPMHGEHDPCRCGSCMTTEQRRRAEAGTPAEPDLLGRLQTSIERAREARHDHT